MQDVTPLPILGITLLAIAFLILIPMMIKVNLSLNMTKKCVDLVIKLFGFITVAKVNFCIKELFLVASTKRKETKLPLWKLKLKPPKVVYLLKAFKLIRINTDYNLNVFALTKNNILAYFNVAAMYTANGALLGNGIDSVARFDITNKDSIMSIDIYLSITIAKLIKVIMEEGEIWKSKVKTKSSR